MGIPIQGSASGNVAEVDGQNAIRIQPSPVNIGALGSFSVTVKSGIMAAGLAGAAPVVAFLWKPATVTSSLCLMRKMKFSLYNLGTGFAAGDFLFEWYVARAF